MLGLYHTLLSLLTDPKHTRWIAPLLILSETVLCFLIVLYVPYTEIDYTTYMAQVHQYLQHGERNYAKISGPTGPLVYPAMHVWIYSALYYLTTIRDASGEIVNIDVPMAQIVFACLYLVTLAVVIACYRKVDAPPWLLVPLVMSKRLHSIFMLRLFNDGWATFFLWLTIYALQRKQWPLATIIWSVGIAVKMTVLLAAPALATIVIQAMEAPNAFYMGFASASIQVLVAVPFIEGMKGGDIWTYAKRSFDFGRKFLFKWTVNWRFVSEKTFLSTEFAVGLLMLHLSLLITFVHTKWVRVSSPGIKAFVTKFTREVSDVERSRIEKRLTSTFVMDAILGSMVIGLLCARSLHYQFYAYIGWATPFLLWRGTGSMILTLGIWAAQEWSWLVFPSTVSSSAVVVASLALQVLSALVSQPVDGIGTPPAAMEELQDRVKEPVESKKSL